VYNDDMVMKLSEDEWKKRLTPEQYRVLRQKDTEMPGTGALLHNNTTGDYTCAACGAQLFHSDSKYESVAPGLIGWPSFADPADNDAVELRPDDSLGMERTEVICKNCGGHLGHLFEEKESPSGKHYCINSCALGFQPKEPAAEEPE
jgi:peptide-methionine (R)-S-oxide reductase